MTLLISYLRGKWKTIFVFGVFCLIFGVVFALYRLPQGAVVYPALLCSMLGIFAFILDFRKTVRKHNELEQLRRMTAAMINHLPQADTIEHKDYQKIIRMLQSEAVEIEAASEVKYNDMIDYYTTWVHQIKTPIASMRLHLQSEDTALARKMQGELSRIEQYVEMVLAFLRLDSTSNDYVFKAYSLDAMIRQAVKKFSHEFIGRKIALSYVTVDKTIITDEKWLLFVLEQIISNALKYTHKGKVSIYLRRENILCIEDTGIGIAPEDIPRIFEKGYTGYNGRNDKKASGLGLYLSKKICDNLGIGISVKSETGKGTVVELGLEQYNMKENLHAFNSGISTRGHQQEIGE